MKKSAGQRLPGTPEPMHRISTAEGLQIAADSWGERTGPPVVLLHGGGQTRHAWRRTGRNLGALGYCALAMDLRGHGDSDWSESGDYGQDAYIQDLCDVVLSWGGPAPVLVGASMGAGIALLAVGEGRVAASGLVLIDYAPTTERSGFERLRSFMARHEDGFASLQDAAASIDEFRGEAGQSRDPSGLAKVLRLGADGRYHWHWDRRHLAWRDREFPTRHLRMNAAARRLAVPTLLVRAGMSDVLSEAGARELLDLCPHAEYICIEGAGHMVAGDANDGFGRAISPFLERVAPVLRD